ncbi:nuclear factor 7, ovary-like isoform X2 [Polypterus senegalus]|uniref:nuclear factor 7, ovary-like isoform X2 n=1 Tax=Polypterus senegalus TaxID=55291 RepID=UPI00196599D9|nr:nuclear factor 7, ovary-like isoform X2 [Polypterus senegalus]
MMNSCDISYYRYYYPRNFFSTSMLCFKICWYKYPSAGFSANKNEGKWCLQKIRKYFLEGIFNYRMALRLCTLPCRLCTPPYFLDMDICIWFCPYMFCYKICQCLGKFPADYKNKVESQTKSVDVSWATWWMYFPALRLSGMGYTKNLQTQQEPPGSFAAKVKCFNEVSVNLEEENEVLKKENVKLRNAFDKLEEENTALKKDDKTHLPLKERMPAWLEVVCIFSVGALLVFSYKKGIFSIKGQSNNGLVIIWILPTLPLAALLYCLREKSTEKITYLKRECDEQRSQNDKLQEEKATLKRELNELEQEFDLLGVVPEKAGFVLNHNSRHPDVLVDSDASQVRFGGNTQGPDRWYCVTGSLELSRNHYWEVEVGEKSSWAIGVVTKEIKEKNIIPESTDDEFWIIRLCRGKKLEAVQSSTVTELQKTPKKVGVYLKGNLLSFYDVETRQRIHNFHIECSGPLFSAFSPGSRDKGPLILKTKGFCLKE